MSADARSDRYRQGMATRRAVLGDAHVDRAEARKTPDDTPFQDMITEGAWGHVWSRDAISLRERSMITMALLAASGNDEELVMHARATANTGVSRQDIMEALLHVALYAGLPRANHAIKLVSPIFDELEGKGAP